MPINYKKELETAAKGMILIHEPNLLIKMILRMFIQKLKVNHASILLHDKDKDAYILTDSGGSLRSSIPIGLARMDKDDALIRFFREHRDKLLFKTGILNYLELKKLLDKPNIENKLRYLLEQVAYQMGLLETMACIPCYFGEELLGIILLGKKKNKRNFTQEDSRFFVALASNVTMAIRNAQLFKELELELDKKKQLFIRLTFALTAAIEAKDLYTHGHTTRVTNLSLEIAKRISQIRKKEFNRNFFEELHIASLLHDIGKIGIPESILNKNGPLTDEEIKIIREHPLIGVNILQPIKELGESVMGVKYHHERHDGKGYPEGLKGDDIPIIAAIIAVADSFDAMTSDRPYRRHMPEEEALAEIKRLSGLQFNPLVATAFINLCSENKVF